MTTTLTRAFCPRCGDDRETIFINVDRDDLTRDTMVCRGSCSNPVEGSSQHGPRQPVREVHSSRLTTDGGAAPQASPRRSVSRRVR